MDSYVAAMARVGVIVVIIVMAYAAKVIIFFATTKNNVYLSANFFEDYYGK
jgi:hypothetical protein